MNFKREIKNNEEFLIEVLSNLVSYKTVENKMEEGYVFGKQNKLCLDYFLSCGKKLGFVTKNLDNYCGYIEYGKGTEVVGIVCHLDVVPEGDGWDTNPYSLTYKNGFLYGRGTSDDKGAAAASLLALKILKENNFKTNKKIRLIVGCNEESGSLCMKHYRKKEGDFSFGFTPDGDFPCICGEKGIVQANFTCSNTNIINIKAGTANNIVPDKCEITVKNNSFDINKFTNYLKDNGLNFTINKDDDVINITVIGKNAHASIPENGKNAITYTLYALNEAGYDDLFVKEYCNIIDIQNNGNKLNINYKDKYSSLTMVNSTINKVNDKITGTLDIRVPITIKNNLIIDSLTKLESIIKFEIIMNEDALYYSPDSKLVNSLMNAYYEVTKDYDAKPKVIGGGTYAKSLNNCIAFGCEFSPNENNIHEANEKVSKEELLVQTELYINAILELDKL